MFLLLKKDWASPGDSEEPVCSASVPSTIIVPEQTHLKIIMFAKETQYYIELASIISRPALDKTMSIICNNWAQ